VREDAAATAFYTTVKSRFMIYGGGKMIIELDDWRNFKMQTIRVEYAL
jgi:hypothetical protein